MYVCGLLFGRLYTIILLLVSISLWDKLSAFIAQHCQNFDEDQLTDMGNTIPCEHGPGQGPYAECYVTNLKKDLMEVKSGVRTLCINQNDMVIHTGAFSHFPSLKRLQISGTGIKRVESGAFTSLPNLTSLCLQFHDSKCREVSLDPGVFEGLENLEELDIRGLKLPGISDGTFKSLLGLVNLQLEYICSANLGDVFCLLPTGMSRLHNVALRTSDITAIKNQGCTTGSKEWPTVVLSKVKALSLEGTPVVTIEKDSLKVFQNLSSLTLDFQGKSISAIWESGIGQVMDLQLNGNVIKNLHVDLKSLCDLVNNLTVKSLTLNYIQAERLSAADTEKCEKELEKFGIWNSKIQNIDLHFWTNLISLIALDIVHVRLNESDFCSGQHQALSKLISLDLKNNLLSVIRVNQFTCMPNLEILDLSFNLIATLEKKAFNKLSHLRILRLTHNKISDLHSDDFKWLPVLEILDIDQNLINGIENGAFRKQAKLQELRLGKLDIIYILNINLIFYGIPPTMRYLSIDAGHGTNFKINPSTSSPIGKFILHLSGDLLELNLCDNNFFKAVRELKVNATQFTCRSEFMVRCFPNLESFEYYTHTDKVSIRYTGISTLRKLKRLKLTNLNFANQTDSATIFHNLTKLEILVLSNCQLSFLTKRMFQNLTALRVLRLYSTVPFLLLDGVFEPLTSLTTVVFDRVDFRCDCENSWLLTWAERSIQPQVIYLERQKCVWHYKKHKFLSTMERLCETDLDYLCYLGTALTISFFMATAVGYNFGRWPFLVLFFRVRGWLDRRIGKRKRRKRRGGGMDGVEEKEEERMQFDAFVSFSSRDEAWVLGELAPRLEEQGEPRLRLCLHNRDFEVGKGIVDNIAESIYNSRRTVCVLSRRYLRSDWCALELRVATHRLLAEQKHRLILIFLEHISPFELSAFHRLAKLVTSRTYLDWPDDEAERVNFWERLRRNIAEGEI